MKGMVNGRAERFFGNVLYGLGGVWGGKTHLQMDYRYISYLWELLWRAW